MGIYAVHNRMMNLAAGEQNAAAFWLAIDEANQRAKDRPRETWDRPSDKGKMLWCAHKAYKRIQLATLTKDERKLTEAKRQCYHALLHFYSLNWDEQTLGVA